MLFWYCRLGLLFGIIRKKFLLVRRYDEYNSRMASRIDQCEDGVAGHLHKDPISCLKIYGRVGMFTANHTFVDLLIPIRPYLERICKWYISLHTWPKCNNISLHTWGQRFGFVKYLRRNLIFAPPTSYITRVKNGGELSPCYSVLQLCCF